ncbi:hypothetical protein FOZ61_001228 [Perkinsus olseni]|uniref:Uncharacterized protein n=1 Tax=Perkinsus olseni TaxID=32597 RepID=A0A7J6KRM8_PEROL|nr:hypothetical protein FOZ61_001228 [Perkinsus olseni]
MNGRCWLINAGVMLASPDENIFQLLNADVSIPQHHHLKGMTPEQHYLAGLLAPYLSHIDQSYNFEIQLHGGVPITAKWRELSYSDIKIVHYSGGEIQSASYSQSFLGRQDKYIARKLYNRLPCEVQDLAYQRAQAAWGDFNINLAEAAITVRDNLKDNHHQLLNNNTMVHGYYETFIERSGMRGLLYWGDVTGDAAATSPTIHSDDDEVIAALEVNW